MGRSLVHLFLLADTSTAVLFMVPNRCSILDQAYGVAQENGGPGCSVYAHHSALMTACKQFNGTMGVFYDLFLHGLHNPAGVRDCFKYSQQTPSFYVAMRSLRAALEAAQSFKAVKIFPYLGRVLEAVNEGNYGDLELC